VLPGSPELSALATGEGFLPLLSSGTTWVDMTSAAPEVGRMCAERAHRRGVAYLDAPLAGGAEAVRTGKATVYVGGEATTVETARPVLAGFAATAHHVGPHGTGHLVKLLINSLWFGQVGLVAEVLLLAQRHGLDARDVAELMHGSPADSAFVAQHLPALLAGDYLAEFGLDRCVEELTAVEDAAEAADVPHSLLSAVTDLHRDALRHFGAVDGELLAAAWLENQAGATLADGGAS